MTTITILNPDDLELITGISLTSIGFIVYWFISLSESIKNSIYRKYSARKREIIWILFQKLSGVLFLGILPGIICLVLLKYTFADFGINFNNLRPGLYYFLALSAIIVPFTIYSARKKAIFSKYPQIRIREWNYKLIIINTLNWTIYIFAYEFLFRGILLKTSLSTLSYWPAIVINTSLYSCTHIPKGSTETLAAIPFGVILCIITIHTGSIWVAFLAHLLLALTNDFAALYFNPEMKIRL
jgi:membrane protease YdiL (CAAX protease family)